MPCLAKGQSTVAPLTFSLCLCALQLAIHPQLYSAFSDLLFSSLIKLTHGLFVHNRYTMPLERCDAICYDPPQFFSSSSEPLLVTLPMPKRPLPLNPSSLPDLPPLPPSKPSKPSSPIDQPPVEPLVPVPWNIHRREYSSMEMYQEPPPVENPLEDPDSPMEDALPLEPQPVTCYEPDVSGGQTHTLSPEESPIEPWEAYLTQPSC